EVTRAARVRFDEADELLLAGRLGERLVERHADVAVGRMLEREGEAVRSLEPEEGADRRHRGGGSTVAQGHRGALGHAVTASSTAPRIPSGERPAPGGEAV